MLERSREHRVHRLQPVDINYDDVNILIPCDYPTLYDTASPREGVRYLACDDRRK